MSKSIKIFQIYFKEELKDQCDPAFTPLSNVENPNPHLREWDVWNRQHEEMMASGLDYWGYVSWKFKQKINLTGQEVIHWIDQNPGYDVYLLNPCVINEAVWTNSWEQGDNHHPNISKVGNEFLIKCGYDNPDVKTLLIDRQSTVYANYVVGSRDWWDKFMTFSRRLFTEAEKDPVFNHYVFGEGLSNYAYDRSLPNFTFLIERLIPTFIVLENYKSIAYEYTDDKLPEKYKPYIQELRMLSNLKVLVNAYQSDELYDIWVHYRSKFLSENPGICNLE